MSLSRYSLANMDELKLRPSSCRFRHISSLTSKQIDQIMRRPITAKNSMHGLSNLIPPTSKKPIQNYSRKKQERALEKYSECKSIFATDLRFVLEQQNIKKMNVEIDKIFCTNKTVTFQRPKSGVTRKVQKNKNISIRPSSACCEQKFATQSQKNHHQILPIKTLEGNKQNEPEVMNKTNKYENQYDLMYMQLLKNRQQLSSFIQLNSGKVNKLILHYQNPKYSQHKSYKEVQFLGEQFIQNDIQLVQKPLYKPRRITKTEDLSYFEKMISKIEETESNIQQIISRPRQNFY